MEKISRVETFPNLVASKEPATVYDVACKSIPELVYLIMQRLNETIEHMNKNDATLQDHLDYVLQQLEEFYLKFDENLRQEIQIVLQAWIEDGTLEQVISQLVENRAVYPSIQALQQAPNIFQLGAIVELQGYHYAGDGAGHKRIISETDDGSGVAVGNKWANLIGDDLYVEHMGADENADLYPIFMKAKTRFNRVFLQSKTYKLSKKYTFETGDKFKEIQGVNSQSTKIICAESGFYAESYNFRMSNLEIRGTNKLGVGLEVYKRYNITGISIFGFGIGLASIDENKHLVSGSASDVVIQHNSEYGVKLVHTGDSQKNNLSFDSLYVVATSKDGTGFDWSKPATSDYGHGFYMSGGYAISITNSVFEYNSGVGLYVENNFSLFGCQFTNNYFECNKYSQFLMTSKSGGINLSLLAQANYFTDGDNKSLPAPTGQLSPTTRRFDFLGSLLSKPENSSIIEQYGYAHSNIARRSHGFDNLYPDPFFEEYDKTTSAAFVKFAEMRAFKYTPSTKISYTDYNANIFVNPFDTYKLKINAKCTAAGTRNISIVLRDKDTNEVVYNKIVLTSTEIHDWKELEFSNIAIPSKSTRRLQMTIQCLNDSATNEELYLRGIRFCKEVIF